MKRRNSEDAQNRKKWQTVTKQTIVYKFQNDQTLDGSDQSTGKFKLHKLE